MKLIDKCNDEWTLGKVTARREKGLKELGIIRENFDADKENNIDTVVNKMLNELSDDLLKLVNLLFEGRVIKKEELEDLDKTEVKVAVFSFFMSDLKLIERFGNLMPILSSQK